MVLRTFQIPLRRWEKFQRVAKENNLTASGALRAAIRRFIADPKGKLILLGQDAANRMEIQQWFEAKMNERMKDVTVEMASKVTDTMLDRVLELPEIKRLMTQADNGKLHIN